MEAAPAGSYTATCYLTESLFGHTDGFNLCGLGGEMTAEVAVICVGYGGLDGGIRQDEQEDGCRAAQREDGSQ